MSLQSYRMPSLRDKIEGITNEEIKEKTEELKKATKKVKKVKGSKKLGKKLGKNK